MTETPLATEPSPTAGFLRSTGDASVGIRETPVQAQDCLAHSVQGPCTCHPGLGEGRNWARARSWATAVELSSQPGQEGLSHLLGSPGV